MERVGEHPVPAGPIAVRWLAYELPELRAGTVAPGRVALRNDGTATWRSRGELGVRLSYHWLDDRGNAIVWDGPRVNFERPVAPGEQVEMAVSLRAPQPPGRYRLAFDLVDEWRFWFAGDRLVAAPASTSTCGRGSTSGDWRSSSTAARTRRRRLRSLCQEEPLVDEDAVAVAHLVPGASPAARLVTPGPRRARRRVSSPSAARSRAARKRCGHGRPAVVATRTSRTRSSFPRSSPASSRASTKASPPTSPTDDEPTLFDGRITLRLPGGRRRG